MKILNVNKTKVNPLNRSLLRSSITSKSMSSLNQNTIKKGSPFAIKSYPFISLHQVSGKLFCYFSQLFVHLIPKDYDGFQSLSKIACEITIPSL